MMTEMTKPRAWVGCLACYNAGRLNGQWVDGTEADALYVCYTPDHDEWWVLDHEGYGPALDGECSPAVAQEVAETLADVADLADGDAFFAYLSHFGTDHGTLAESAEAFGDSFVGEYESEREYAQEFADDIGLFDNAPDTLARYFSYDAFARDLFMSDMVSVPCQSGGIYVFHVNT